MWILLRLSELHARNATQARTCIPTMLLGKHCKIATFAQKVKRLNYNSMTIFLVGTICKKQSCT